MFSKPAVSRRFEWIRGKVASSAQVDVESGQTQGSNNHPGVINLSPFSRKKICRPDPKPQPSYPSWSPDHAPREDDMSTNTNRKNKKTRPRSRSVGDNSSYLNPDFCDNVAAPGDRSQRRKPNRGSLSHGGLEDASDKNLDQYNESDPDPVVNKEIQTENPSEKFALRTNHLKAYLEQMYYVGVSPYQTAPLRTNASRNWMWWTVHLLQKVLFGVITFMSAWQSMSNAKLCYIYFMSGVGLHNFVDFGFHFVSFLTKGQHVCTMLFRKKMVGKMLESMSQYEQKYNNKPGNGGAVKLATALGISTVLIVVLRYMTHGIFEWSLKDLILDNSAEFSTNVFIWNHKNLTYKEDQIYEKYGGKITPTTVAFGMYIFVADISSGIQMDSIRNLLLLSACNLYAIVSNFMKRIDETMKNVSPNEADACDELQANRESCWPMYRHVKEVVTDSNDVNDGMLKILHVDNLLLYAHFVTICITKSDTTLANIIYYLWTIAKSELTYYIAGLIAGFNDPLRKWIRNWGRHTGRINIDNEELDVNIILDELTNEPLGFGKGNFLIKPTFHFKFLGLVGSLALFLADERKKDQ